MLRQSIFMLLFLHCIQAENRNLDNYNLRMHKCILKSRSDCQNDLENNCAWYEELEKCKAVDHIRHRHRHIMAAIECEDITSKTECSSWKHCRWCKSEVLDDACFGALEARRLPVQVFDCLK